ncbi:MAG: site-specific DNA-methyltransferase [Chloroflexota bacterium]
MNLPVVWQPATNEIYNYDALTFTRHLPAQSVQCVVTSPPYFGLRNYGAVGQWGLEPTIDSYVSNLVVLFREIRRVLADDGTVWLNLGDTRANDSKWGGVSSGIQAYAAESIDGTRTRKTTGLPDKNLIGIPWRVALALQADGWILRSDIIWHKNNPMPESVKDRPTSAHEYIFLLTKSPRYYYNADAIREPNSPTSKGNRKQFRSSKYTQGRSFNNTSVVANDLMGLSGQKTGRNKWTVWTIPTRAFPQAHFATFPPQLPRLCVLAGSRADDLIYDPFMGAGTTAVVARQLGRQFIGCDVNPDYVAMARHRLKEVDPYQPTVIRATEHDHVQMSLFQERRGS